MTSVPHLCQAAAMGWYAGQLWGAWGLLRPGAPYHPAPACGLWGWAAGGQRGQTREGTQACPALLGGRVYEEPEPRPGCPRPAPPCSLPGTLCSVAGPGRREERGFLRVLGTRGPER